MFGLKKQTIDALVACISTCNEVEKVVIYGSRAKGNYRNGSDIDLVFFGENLTLSVLLRLETEIDDLLLPYTIDAAIFHHIKNPDLIDHINRVGKVFYERQLEVSG
ncbi:MAG: nucleotidyltransferase domain-containing protein [Bacteroidia bacterium]